MKYVVTVTTPNPDYPKRIQIVEGADAPTVKAEVVKVVKLAPGEDVEVREFDPVADEKLEAELAAAAAAVPPTNGRGGKG